MRATRLALMASIAGLGLFVSQDQAHAWQARQFTLESVKRTVEHIDDTTENTDREVNGLRNDFNQFARQLGIDMRSATAEQSAYMDKSIDANRRITDAAQINQVMLEKQKVRAKVETETTVDPLACFVMGMFQPADASVESVPGQGSHAAGSVLTELSTVPPGGEVKKAAEVAAERIAYEGRDDATTDFSVLMSSPTIDMNATVNATNTDDDTVRGLAQSIIRNIIDPNPEEAVTDTAMSGPDGAVLAAEIKGKRARQSVALEALAMVMNMSEPVVDNAPIQALVQGTPYNRTWSDSGKSSELQAIDALVVSYYAPSDEARKKSLDSNSILQRILQVVSIQARMQYLSLELQRRQASMDAAMLATQVEGAGRR